MGLKDGGLSGIQACPGAVDVLEDRIVPGWSVRETGGLHPLGDLLDHPPGCAAQQGNEGDCPRWFARA